MICRKATIKDIDQLCILFDLYRVFYQKESDPHAARKFMLDRLQQNDAEIFVAENENNSLTGFVQLYPIFSSTRMKKLWLLNDLFVDEKYRKLGVSILLINKAKELCVESKSCGMILETAKSNLIANTLYQNTGFSLDIEHNYYSWDT